MNNQAEKKWQMPYQIIGVFNSYGGYRWKVIFKEPDGTLSQQFPGHFDQFAALCHKRWRWWVKEKRLDHPALMDWTPDVEEMDIIERLVEMESSPRQVPRYSMDGVYPNWREIS